MRTMGTFDISPLIYKVNGSRNTVLFKRKKVMNIIHSECLGQHIYYISTCMSKHKSKQFTKWVCSKCN